jgi:3-carboxy-cis,cis-muconate cycloisomerase
VKGQDEAAARAIHLGATSQDVLDTALVLQMRDALALIVAAIERMEYALAGQVRAHADTLMTGRTWLQPGPPTTLGLKLAGTLVALRRHRARIHQSAERALVIQFGGAVGTLAALGPAGAAVSAELARILDLKEPILPWHTQRDNVVEVAQVLALLTGTLGKLARDIALLMQAEVGEVSEPLRAGRGGSSTMPHKRNPVACAAVLAAAARLPGLLSTMLTAMPQEHERGLGLWQAEWETLPEIFRLSAAALERSIEIAEGLTVDAARMQENFDATLRMPLSEAVVAALAPKIGRSAAHGILERAILQASSGNHPLANILKSLPEVTVHLSDAEIDRLLEPGEYLGSARRFIERALGESDADC